MKSLARACSKKDAICATRTGRRSVGVRPGSVSIFGLLHPGAQNIQVIVDESLMQEPELGFHPNDNTASVFLKPDDVVRVITITNHDYRILAL
ncbi:hypothetical protein IPL68_05005 [Candidatus Saccharibacteria bacterium]|nr:MAG: hypothetical protein IPL68_05005 [Candidatus Saccharibacteria bacterium]